MYPCDPSRARKQAVLFCFLLFAFLLFFKNITTKPTFKSKWILFKFIVTIHFKHFSKLQASLLIQAALRE